MSFHLKYRLFIVSCYFFFGFSEIYPQSLSPGMATPICNEQSITAGAPGNSGINDIHVCGLDYPPLSPYIDFYRVVIQSGSTFVFVVTPNGEVDYDFGAWKNPNWEDILFTPAEDRRGSQNDPFLTGVFHTGLSLTDETLCEPGGTSGEPEPGLVKYFDVQPGDEILIALDRWSITDVGYTIDFGGDAILDCTILGHNFFKCIDEDVSTENFEMEELTSKLEEEFPNSFFKYYSLEEDAENDSGPQIEFPFTVVYNDGDPTAIYVRVEDADGTLLSILEINLYLSKFPQLLSNNLNLESICDDGTGKATIDLTQYDELLIAAEEEDIQIRYYSDENAYQTGNHIENPTTYEVENDQIFIAEAINVFSGCTSKDYARLKVNLEQKPTADLSAYDGAVICQNTGRIDEELTSIEVETGLSETDYNFTWLYEGEILTETGANLLVNSGGNYSVVITNKEGIGCEHIADFTIYEWGPPQFQIKPTRPGFTQENGIKVFNINGLGVYVFKVNDGDWKSPDANGTVIFDNISPGPHLVYGKDVGGCGELILPITLLGYPNFFTPNGDGINDTWNIIGLQDQPDAKISIFDRYGKLLTQISPGNVGWDGTFHGKNMSSNEYWFKIEFKETLIIEDGQEIKQPTIHTGHFTLKR